MDSQPQQAMTKKSSQYQTPNIFEKRRLGSLLTMLTDTGNVLILSRAKQETTVSENEETCVVVSVEIETVKYGNYLPWLIF
jgi:hypothetical protein